MDILINQSHTFERTLTNNQGNFVTGATITFEIRNIATDALITSGSLTEQNEVYKTSFTFTTLGQFRVKYFTPTNFPNDLESVDIVDSIPDQVWDENLGDHLNSGTTGEALDGADAMSDPAAIANEVWTSNQSGIGRQLTEGTKDAEIDAIKGKTDNLPVNPSSETNATANTNSIISEVDANEAKIDSIITTLSTLVADVWGFGTRTLTSFGTLVSDIWSNTIRTLTAIGSSGIASEANATTNKNDIITEVNANETKIDALPDANAIADQVWDEPLADHLGAGSTGEALDDADATADPTAVANAVWTSDQTGIGRQLTEGTKDAEIDAIKAKTDNLPVDPASETNATANKNAIIAEIDANELKIDSISSDITAHRTAVEDKIRFILGLTQHNTRIVPLTYDGNDQLTSATINLYDTATDAENDTNVTKQYSMTTAYDLEGKMTSYIVSEI